MDLSEIILKKANEYSEYTASNLSKLIQIKSLSGEEKGVVNEVKRMMEEANKRAALAAEGFRGKIYGYISICPGEGIDKVKKELKVILVDPDTLSCAYCHSV